MARSAGHSRNRRSAKKRAGKGRDLRAGGRTVDTATIASVIASLLPHCDVARAHLADVLANSTRATTEVIDLAGRIDDLAHELDRSGVAEPARELSGCAASLAGEMQFDDIGRQMVEHIGMLLADLREQLTVLRSYAEGTIGRNALMEHTTHVDAFAVHHVMQAQRISHAAATGLVLDIGLEPPIELF